MTEHTALDECEAAIKRLTSRVGTLSRLLTASFAVIIILTTALLGQYVILSRVDTGITAIRSVDKTGECRTSKVVAIDQIKDAPDRTPLALELLAPGTSEERRAVIALRFGKDAARIKQLQDERLACRG